MKRAAFSLLACLAWHDKKTEDEKFIELLPVIKRGALDERNYVRKAVNWALRNIGKRNLNLNKAVLVCPLYSTFLMVQLKRLPSQILNEQRIKRDPCVVVAFG